MSPPGWTLDRDASARSLEMLRGSRHVLMPTHQNVDADGLATPLALAHALETFGVTSTVVVSDGQLPKNLQFLPGVDRVLCYGEGPLPEYDVLLLADCADRRRVGGFYADDPDRLSGVIPIVNVDHHVTNALYGAVNIVEPTAAATSEVVAALLAEWNVPITEGLAQCLLAGIYGDTLGLRTSSATSRTMRTAADLVDAGANPEPVVDALFRVKPKSTVCLWERALGGVHWTGRVIWTDLTRATLEECRAMPSEAEGFVNFLAGTEGSLVAVMFYETDFGWRVSMRSLPEDVNVAAIAAEFGGGGHPRAAGCEIRGGVEQRDAFLNRVSELAATSHRSED